MIKDAGETEDYGSYYLYIARWEMHPQAIIALSFVAVRERIV